MGWLRKYWPVLLVTTVAAIGIQVLEPDWNKLQMADDADEFRETLTSPRRAMAAAFCDVVFAAGYGILGLTAARTLGGRMRLATITAFLIVAAALFDEIENVLMMANIARHESLTDVWIDVMGVVGTIKWTAGTIGFLLLLGLAVLRLVRRGS